MRRMDWIWIFFVIVAVGLVLSWGRTGQRLQKDPDVAAVLSVDRILEAESPCRPFKAPCAALGQDLALVLGPVAEASDLLAMRLVATETEIGTELPEIDWQADGEGFTPQQRLSSRRLQEAEWLIAVPEDPIAPAPSLWVRLRHGGLRYAARFPLRAPILQ